VEFRALEGDPQLLSQTIDDKKPDVVPGFFVFVTDIA